MPERRTEDPGRKKHLCPSAFPHYRSGNNRSPCSRSQTLYCCDHSCFLITAVGVESTDTNLRTDMQGRLFLYNRPGLLMASDLPPGGTGVMDVAATTPSTGDDNFYVRPHLRMRRHPRKGETL